MSITYLNNSWSAITREERYFCAHLYFLLRDPENMLRFIQFLNKNESPLNRHQNKLQLNKTGNWEASYEVCFYRDFLYSLHVPVKRNKAKLVDLVGEENYSNLIKRTFDLCLFSDKQLVIIEAKVQQSFHGKQLEDIRKDKMILKVILNEFSKNQPEIKTVLLAGSAYFSSHAFLKANGLGNKLSSYEIDSIISWKQIFEIFNEYLVFEQADNCYKN